MRRHRKRRRPTYYEVSVVIGDDEVDATILDVAEGGVRMSGLPDSYTGAAVSIRFRTRRVAGRVAWQKDGQTGIALNAPMDPAMLAAVRGDIAAMTGARPRRYLHGMR